MEVILVHAIVRKNIDCYIGVPNFARQLCIFATKILQGNAQSFSCSYFPVNEIRHLDANLANINNLPKHKFVVLGIIFFFEIASRLGSQD